MHESFHVCSTRMQCSMHKYPTPNNHRYSHTTILPAMAKLIILAIAFSALVAFASAHRPIVTTTTTLIEELGVNAKQQCSQQVQGQRFNQCQTYIRSSSSSGTQNRWCCLGPLSCLACMISMEGEHVVGKVQQVQGLEECCNQLQKVQEDCQCEAVQEVYRQAQQQQWSQQSSPQQLQRIVGDLLGQCNLQVKQLCVIPAAMF